MAVNVPKKGVTFVVYFSLVKYVKKTLSMYHGRVLY